MRWTKSTAQILHTFYLVVTGTSFFLNDFPFSWEFHHPNWRIPSFFRGVGLNHQPANDLIRVTSLPVLRVWQKTLRMLMMFTLRNTDTVYFFRSIPSPVITLWWDIPIGSSHIGGTIYRVKTPLYFMAQTMVSGQEFPVRKRHQEGCLGFGRVSKRQLKVLRVPQPPQGRWLQLRAGASHVVALVTGENEEKWLRALGADLAMAYPQPLPRPYGK